jgi:hypothetical protein
MFTYSDTLTLTILIIIWIYIILLFQFNWDFIYSAIIHVSDVSDDQDEIFACWVQRPLSTKQPEFALSVAVVDTRSPAGAGNHCEGSVLGCMLLVSWVGPSKEKTNGWGNNVKRLEQHYTIFGLPQLIYSAVRENTEHRGSVLNVREDRLYAVVTDNVVFTVTDTQDIVSLPVIFAKD